LAVAEDVGDLGGAVAGVDRHMDRAEVVDPEHRDDLLEAWLGEHRHAIAPTDTGAAERVGEGSRLVVELSPAQTPTLELVGSLVTGGLERLEQMTRPAPSHVGHLVAA